MPGHRGRASRLTIVPAEGARSAGEVGVALGGVGRRGLGGDHDEVVGHGTDTGHTSNRRLGRRLIISRTNLANQTNHVTVDLHIDTLDTSRSQRRNRRLTQHDRGVGVVGIGRIVGTGAVLGVGAGRIDLFGVVAAGGVAVVIVAAPGQEPADQEDQGENGERGPQPPGQAEAAAIAAGPTGERGRTTTTGTDRGTTVVLAMVVVVAVIVVATEGATGEPTDLVGRTRQRVARSIDGTGGRVTDAGGEIADLVGGAPPTGGRGGEPGRSGGRSPGGHTTDAESAVIVVARLPGIAGVGRAGEVAGGELLGGVGGGISNLDVGGISDVGVGRTGQCRTGGDRPGTGGQAGTRSRTVAD